MTLIPDAPAVAAGYDISGAPHIWAPGQTQTFQVGCSAPELLARRRGIPVLA